MSAETDLLPCPFCGPGESVVSLWFDDVSNRFRVGCGRCGCSTGTHPRDKTETPAIAAWNTRANLAELQREVEGLRAEVALLRTGAENERLHQSVLLGRARDRAERLAEALRRMVGASYVVCTTIDPRGHSWCEAYLDEALPEARAALDQETTNG